MDSFTIPDETTSLQGPVHSDLAEPKSRDFEALAQRDTGLVSGGDVTPKTPASMLLGVVSGVARIAGVNHAFTSGDVTITANASGLPRYDAVVVNASGVKSVIAGTPAAETTLDDPAVDLTQYCWLRKVYVTSGATAITETELVSKAIPQNPDAFHDETHPLNGPHTGTLDDAQIPSGIARDSEVTSVIGTHAGAADPHGDRAFATSSVAGLTSGAFALSGDISPTALSASVDDYAPTGLSTAAVLRLSTNNSTQRTIFGLTGGADGRILLVHNLGTGIIGFKDEATSSAAANRFALAGDMNLLPDSSCLMQYDSTSSRWRILARATAATDPAITYGATNVGGTSPYFVRSDDQLIDPTIAHVAATNPHTSGAFALSGDISPTALSADADDYNPTGLSTASTIRLSTNSGTLRTITGLQGGADGRIIILHNLGPGWVGLKDNSSNSSAANRFQLAGDNILLPDSAIMIQYDSTSACWRAIRAATAATDPALVFSTTNLGGVSPYFMRSDDQLALFDTTVPAKTSTAGAVGTAAVAARRDHQHPNRVSSTGTRVDDDFFYAGTVAPANGAPIGWASAYFVGGAVLMSQIFPGTGNHPGIATLSTLTSATGYAGIASSTAQIVFGGGRCRYGAWVQVPVVSDGTNRFGSTVGFFDSLTTFAANVDGCFFHYTDNVNSGAWSVTTIANSVATATSAITTGITAVAGTWYFLEVEVNAAGTSVAYYVDGVLKVTHTTNIPVGAGRETGVGVFQAKSVGTTARLFHIDSHYLELDFTTAR